VRAVRTGARGNFGYLCNGKSVVREDRYVYPALCLACPHLESILLRGHKPSKVLRDRRLSTFLPRLIENLKTLRQTLLRDNDPPIVRKILC